MKLAVAQLAPVPGDLQGNLERTRERIEAARAAAAELVVFPELNLSGYLDENVTLDPADPRLRALSGKVAVLLGFPETHASGRFNSAGFYAEGQLHHVHRKLILPQYGPFTERARFVAGDGLHAFDTPVGRAAVLLCEDVVQPAFATIAAQDGAELLLIPANSAHSLLPAFSPLDHWRSITGFYAQLTQSTVVFANRVGCEGPFRFWGGSHVIDPQGRVLAQAPEDEEALLLVDVDPDVAAHRRAAVPLLQDPRLDVVARELQRLGRAEVRLRRT